MPIVVIVITGAAADLGRVTVNQRNYGMVRNSPTLNAVVVYYVT
ncbi:MAG: hypothetical protein WBW33_27205 [Bryobacteraceae bacterium]